MQCRAQVSLEFLLVVASALFVMLLIAPAIVAVSTRALHAAELTRAKLFASDLEFALRKLNAFSDGSELLLVCKPLTEWKFSLSSKNVTITVNGSTFLVNSPISFASKMEFTISERTCMRLKRKPASIELSVEDC
ncbi:MAG: hypothetical protein J7L44_02835 [Candidatus Diapherotrites archaeon]|nr:hypothetical protein [Candidatus Diapherotrites archaeon]